MNSNTPQGGSKLKEDSFFLIRANTDVNGSRKISNRGDEVDNSFDSRRDRNLNRTPSRIGTYTFI